MFLVGAISAIKFDSGTNYFKFENGFAIIFSNITTPSVGSKANGTFQIVYPFNFVAEPTVVCSLFDTLTPITEAGVNIYNQWRNSNMISVRVYNNYSQPLTMHISVITIGKWK